MVVPSFSRIHFSLDLSTFIRSLSLWYNSRQAFSSQPTCGLIARTAICASECLRVCRRMSILSITTHILYVLLSMCAQKHVPVYFPPGKGTRRKEEKHLSLSLSLLSFVIVVRAEFSDGSYLDSIISRILRIENIMPIVGGISFFKFEVSSFFFFFPIYTTRSRETFSFPRSYLL